MNRQIFTLHNYSYHKIIENTKGENCSFQLKIFGKMYAIFVLVLLRCIKRWNYQTEPGLNFTIPNIERKKLIQIILRLSFPSYSSALFGTMIIDFIDLTSNNAHNISTQIHTYLFISNATDKIHLEPMINVEYDMVQNTSTVLF